MRRRWKAWVGTGGAVLVVAAVGFRLFAVPALVRFPLNVDETAHYTGFALTYNDAETLAPLAQPRRDPLTIDRRIKAVGGDFRRAVIQETVTTKLGTQTSTEAYQYVMDRRSMQLVDDPREYAFGNPAYLIHAAGSYRVNWPMGTKARGSYPSLIVEDDAAAPITLLQSKHYHPEAGVSVIDFQSRLSRPVAPYYLKYLVTELKVPTELSVTQYGAQLAAAGIDVAKALADAGPFLTPAELQLVASTLAVPVKLQYFFIADGSISVEPRTGALVDVHTSRDAIAVQPDLSHANALLPLLDRYASIPSVRAARDGLTKLEAQPPQEAVTLTYTQTPESSRHLGNLAKRQIRLMNLVQLWLPWGAGAIGVVLMVLAGGATIVGSRRRRRAGEPPLAVPTAPGGARPPAAA